MKSVTYWLLALSWWSCILTIASLLLHRYLDDHCLCIHVNHKNICLSRLVRKLKCNYLSRVHTSIISRWFTPTHLEKCARHPLNSFKPKRDLIVQLFPIIKSFGSPQLYSIIIYDRIRKFINPHTSSCLNPPTYSQNNVKVKTLFYQKV